MEHGHSSKVYDDMRYSLGKFQAHYNKEILHNETICQRCFGDPKKLAHTIGDRRSSLGGVILSCQGTQWLGSTLFPRL